MENSICTVLHFNEGEENVREFHFKFQISAISSVIHRIFNLTWMKWPEKLWPTTKAFLLVNTVCCALYTPKQRVSIQNIHFVANKNSTLQLCCVYEMYQHPIPELCCLTCWLRFVSPFQCPYEIAHMHVVTSQNLLLLLPLLIWYLFPVPAPPIRISNGFIIRYKQFINLSITWKMGKIKSTRPSFDSMQTISNRKLIRMRLRPQCAWMAIKLSKSIIVGFKHTSGLQWAVI